MTAQPAFDKLAEISKCFQRPAGFIRHASKAKHQIISYKLWVEALKAIGFCRILSEIMHSEEYLFQFVNTWNTQNAVKAWSKQCLVLIFITKRMYNST